MHGNKGFTLIEAMLAASVLFIGIMVVMSSLSTSFDINLLTEEQSEITTVITHQVEWLKSLPLCDNPATGDVGTLAAPEADTICDIFKYILGTEEPEEGSFSQTKQFPITYFRDENDQPIMGTISAVVPNPPFNVNLLVEFKIDIEYPSTVRGPVSEGTTVWVSPQY